ncbi:hypothetical protein ACT3XG_15695 [Paenibacillus polymyxa]|uniref:hypothetical protein n=1 Tax=Paenibacillus TaxID=44249 RepID=UPI0002DBA899|nr:MULTISPECIES: hypothetical protein [Paenibacillus]KAF6584097.1 hypothetical protein G9G57_08570 [Paenibacillus sp. EKM211P]KAF6659059.1 hypothetical protein HFD99_02270 [Paenibacillus sp. EKM301P]KJD41908.1 hypothetical protein QD46_01825 [Paenibacillus polymyxa]MDU8671941.1 hypothetical protein [Paenibacillus polymyxa]MDU8696850.1 hypothetical protein [Paenibacillus polymyxa]
MNEIKVANDWAQYPMTLRPKHVEEIMKMSPKKTYEFLAGKYILANWYFFNWLDGANFDVFKTTKAADLGRCFFVSKSDSY